jgi:hypothetical protein
MHWLEEAGRAAALRRDTPEQEAADGRSHLRVRLLVRDDGILVIDQGVRISAWSKC